MRSLRPSEPKIVSFRGKRLTFFSVCSVFKFFILSNQIGTVFARKTEKVFYKVEYCNLAFGFRLSVLFKESVYISLPSCENSAPCLI